jgi:uncharacterized protein with PIN domain/tRNA(Ser,Leu) C12 N-acetylase TAN1
MATYLVRYAEAGRERQPVRQKQRRDLAAVIAARLPGAAIAMAPGRLVVDGEPDRADELAAIPGVLSVSPCLRVSEHALAATVVELARRRLTTDDRFAIRVRRAGEHQAIAAGVRTLDVARALGDAVAIATGARVDLSRPDVVIGVELRGDDAYVFDQILPGVDRVGPPAPRADGEPRFLVDQMLGRLGARLRLLGYDALIAHDVADSEVTRRAAADGRILLTRDTELARTRAVPVHFVAATTPRVQLAEVLTALALSPDPARYFTRCTLCNTAVEPVAEADVHADLPPGVVGRDLAFFRCPACAQLYWRGSHVDRILEDLAGAGAP